MGDWISERFGEKVGSPSRRDFAITVSFVGFFFAARFVLYKFVFHSISNWLVGKRPVSSKSKKIKEARKATLAKCSESLWKLLYYGTIEASILMAIYEEPWFRDTYQYFSGWPNQELSLSLKLCYLCQCGFYIYSIVALLVWETRRKDFAVMMSHHVITVLLIGYSYSTSFFRIGAIVLALHDASDVFLETAKIFKYSDNELGASVFFGLFAISWLVLRLIFFPFWVIRASSIDLISHLDLSKAYETSVYYGFNTMLLMLLVFHVYWWFLICSMIKRQLRNHGRVGEDIRSGIFFPGSV